MRWSPERLNERTPKSCPCPSRDRSEYELRDLHGNEMLLRCPVYRCGRYGTVERAQAPLTFYCERQQVHVCYLHGIMYPRRIDKLCFQQAVRIRPERMSALLGGSTQALHDLEH